MTKSGPVNEQFLQEVMSGLSSNPKYLSSKYFYDQKGDALFQEIMNLEEYYLTRSEFEIFQNNKQDLLSTFLKSGKPFDLIEFGAGDGEKTKVLLEYFLKESADFSYLPVDISHNALDLLAKDLRDVIPDLDFQTLQGEYFEALSSLQPNHSRTKIILFLGSNIGNFLKDVAANFLSQLAHSLHPGDLLLLGVDLVKDPDIVAAAYNDSQGITKAFNFNLLTRINNELGGDFKLSNFNHYPFYDPVSGTARSFLISNCSQTVSISHLDALFHFDAWEPIYMELSQKYRFSDLDRLAHSSGFEVLKNYLDSNKYFASSLWEVKNSED